MYNVFMGLAVVALLVCIYSLVGIALPRLPLVRSRPRAAVMAVAAFVVLVVAGGIGMAFEPLEIRTAREAEATRGAERIAQRAEGEKPAPTRDSPGLKEKPAQDEVYANLMLATQLLAAYDANEAAANAKWKNKSAAITGSVKRVHQTLGTTVVEISDSEVDFQTVSCRLQKSELSKALALSKGDFIIAQGVVSEALGFVSLQDCTIHTTLPTGKRW